MYRKYRTTESGFSLIVALLALMLLSAIAIGMMFQASTETAVSANFKAEETAYFAARAGVEEVRDRMRAGTIALPTKLPSNGDSVLYIKQTGVTDANITTAGGKLSDDELCHDFPAAYSMSTATPNVPCASAPSTSWVTTTTSTAPYPLDYKWVRVTLKQNNSSPFPVDSTKVASNPPVCWDGAKEMATGTVDGAGTVLCPNETEKVYLVTSLAVSPSGATPNGARRMVQQEIALTSTSSTLPGGLFATSTACGALKLAGNAKTGSFNSATENPPKDPPSNLTLSNGDIGANGSVSLGGTSTAVNGNISSTKPGLTGTCNNAVNKTGSPTIACIDKSCATDSPPWSNPPQPQPPYTPPTPPMPNPPPPTTTYPPKKGSVPDPLPAGSYGNINVKGTINLAGGADINHPAVFNINSLTMTGNSTLNITGPVILNVAGVGVNPVIDLTGGSFSNNTKIPNDFIINYGGSGDIVLTGGAYPYAVVNAPNAALKFRGTNFYGQAIAATIDDQGGTNFYWDTSVKTTITTTAPYYSEIALRELSY